MTREEKANIRDKVIDGLGEDMTVTEEQIKDIVSDCLIEDLEDIINSAQRAIENIDKCR